VQLTSQDGRIYACDMAGQTYMHQNIKQTYILLCFLVTASIYFQLPNPYPSTHQKRCVQTPLGRAPTKHDKKHTQQAQQI
jgi:hypothetical protein